MKNLSLVKSDALIVIKKFKHLKKKDQLQKQKLFAKSVL
jgi:hypothetical protein